MFDDKNEAQTDHNFLQAYLKFLQMFYSQYQLIISHHGGILEYQTLAGEAILAHGTGNIGFHCGCSHPLVHHVDLHSVKTPLILLDSNIPRTILSYLQFRRSLCGKRKSEFLTTILGKRVEYRLIVLKLKNKISQRSSLRARFPGSSQPPTHPPTPGRKERSA